ncbi:hypothetical protein [Magnetospirillum sp. 15-1]|uniref:hypothetical protein n=1 Tax=Magnetospirillum sp. 15-1 TaxID=1979370 RepID=UPI001143CD50|nr:hypothetical protein [Magnetospirillum sp. 15-1]
MLNKTAAVVYLAAGLLVSGVANAAPEVLPEHVDQARQFCKSRELGQGNIFLDTIGKTRLHLQKWCDQNIKYFKKNYQALEGDRGLFILSSIQCNCSYILSTLK